MSLCFPVAGAPRVQTTFVPKAHLYICLYLGRGFSTDSTILRDSGVPGEGPSDPQSVQSTLHTHTRTRSLCG